MGIMGMNNMAGNRIVPLNNNCVGGGWLIVWVVIG